MHETSKEKEAPVQIASKVLPDGRIVELVSDGEKTSLAVWKEGSYSIEQSVDTPDGQLVPIAKGNNLLRHRAVLLPSLPSEYGTEAELRNDIRNYISTYVDLSEKFLDLAAAYVLLTWVYDAFPELPYLRFLGDFGTGKSRALWVVGNICNKPFFASAASTISPVFYTLDLFRGTLILDEADFRYSDIQADITKILNNGSVAGFPVLRQTQNMQKAFDPRAFTVFGPKVLAMRKNVDDIALESRFLTEEMGARPLRDDIPLNLPREHAAHALELRNKLLMYRFRNLESSAIDPSTLDRKRSGRFNQSMAPLLSVVHDEDVRSNIRAFAEHNERKMKSLRALSLDAELLDTLCQLIDTTSGQTHLSIAEITSSLKEKLFGDTEKPITNRVVGHMLRGVFDLYTYKSHGVYILPHSEFEKVKALALRHGIIEG